MSIFVIEIDKRSSIMFEIEIEIDQLINIKCNAPPKTVM
jgi:hypothetical protein